MIHNFNTDIAEEYGIEEAILLQNIKYWIDKNRANERHFYDGRYWTYNSVSAFSELFPYIHEKKIYRALKNLEDCGLIISGNYNKAGYDRTKWYSVTKIGMDKLSDSIMTKCQMDYDKMSNALDNMGKPIPYNKPDTKPNNKHNKRFSIPSFEQISEYLDNIVSENPEKYGKFDPDIFYNYYCSNGWKVGKNKMVSWEHTVMKWARDAKKTAPKSRKEKRIETFKELGFTDKEIMEQLRKEGFDE